MNYYFCRTLSICFLCTNFFVPVFADDKVKGYIGAQTNYSNFQRSVSEGGIETEDALGGSLYGGVDLNKYFSIELGYGYYGYRNMDQEASYGIDIYAKESLPLSKRTSLNLGFGTYFDHYDFHPAAMIGFNYQLSKAWALDFSYKYFVNAFDAGFEKQDISSINLGINYRFGHKGETQAIQSTKISTPVVAQAAIVSSGETSCPCDSDLANNEVVKKEQSAPICHIEWRKEFYEIKQNDYLYKIARFFGITIHELREWNPQYWNERNPDLVYTNDVLELNVGMKVCAESERHD